MTTQFHQLTLTYPSTCAPLEFALERLQKAVRETAFADCVQTTIAHVADIDAQSYRASVTDGDICIEYTHDDGLMYAVLDLADTICTTHSLQGFASGLVTPYIKHRGIKFNIPLDARSPSYSDESDSAQQNILQMWDMEFWHQYIDELAANKYNGISLWSLAPFSSMVLVDDYPLAALDDVKRTTRPIVSQDIGGGMVDDVVLGSMVTLKKITIQQKIEFWRSVMEYGKSRCIDFYVFTWNLFPFGTETSPYGIDDNVQNPINRDYFRKATERLVTTYPLLAGIGVTAGEWMTTVPEIDVQFIRDTYGKGVEDALQKDPTRKIKFIHRLQYANIETILTKYSDFDSEFSVSLKYSQAHMHAATKPTFCQPVMDALPQNVKMWLTVRNDDYYMLRWGDPEFARAYIQQMPPENLEGFFMGPDGYTWGREYISKNKDVYGKLVLEKMWYSFAIWGKIAFDPHTDDQYFANLLASRFGGEVAQPLFEAWQLASSLLGDFQQTHWRDLDWQWYPEACCCYYKNENGVWFADVNEFMQCVSEPGTDRISVADYAQSVADGTTPCGTLPTTVANRLQQNANRALQMTALLETQVGKNGELAQTLADIKALALLGLYYGKKLDAAIALKLYHTLHDTAKQTEAVALLRSCADIWQAYSDIITQNYEPQHLTRFKQVIDVKRFQVRAEDDILLAEQQ